MKSRRVAGTARDDGDLSLDDMHGRPALTGPGSYRAASKCPTGRRLQELTIHAAARLRPRNMRATLQWSPTRRAKGLISE